MQIIPHQTILINNLSIYFDQKLCFTDFSTNLYFGQRIGIIGRNGSGKTTLLKALANQYTNYDGDILLPTDVTIGYVPQIIHNELVSGGQRFNQSLSVELSHFPNLLLLDEPTNHLDKNNRRSLINMLNRFTGTLVIVTHDTELLRSCVDSLWHIVENKITIFDGNYDDYRKEQNIQQIKLTNQLKSLNKARLDVHERLMREQERAKSSCKHGEKAIKERKWPTVKSATKVTRAVTTIGDNHKQIKDNKEN